MAVCLGFLVLFAISANWLDYTACPVNQAQPKVSIVLVLLISLLAACRGFGEPFTQLRFFWAHLSAPCCWCSQHQRLHWLHYCTLLSCKHPFFFHSSNSSAALQKRLNHNSKSVLIKSHMAVFLLSILECCVVLSVRQANGYQTAYTASFDWLGYCSCFFLIDWTSNSSPRCHS